ncbi:hypothetical protein [Leptolyngbya sp. BC1307]|uniref:hypothetical protein n=1 Tax=Leptolyngbya sp. BC1307 TaxID=2029589 RepID=UPI00148305F6|nr:hypothetical protein [Leptolyngbya sp. BC1307]
MFIPSSQGAAAFTPSFAEKSTAQPEPVRHMLIGTAPAVLATIKHLHKLRYADPNDWSLPMPTGRPSEVMAILTKRVSLE